MNIEQSVKKEEEKLSEITYELDGVHRVRVIVSLTRNQMLSSAELSTCLYIYIQLCP